jgi:3-dehydroquinate dehydratase type I
VTNATNTDDNLTILAFVNEASHDARVVSFAMGKLGVPSRALSPIFGAEFTFAAMNEESRTAVGQLSIDDLRRVWRLLDIA